MQDFYKEWYNFSIYEPSVRGKKSVLNCSRKILFQFLMDFIQAKADRIKTDEVFRGYCTTHIRFCGSPGLMTKAMADKCLAALDVAAGRPVGSINHVH